MPDHEARLAALEDQLGQLTEACATRRRLDEHAGHIDETVVDAFFLLVAAVSRQCVNHIFRGSSPTHWSIFAQVGESLHAAGLRHARGRLVREGPYEIFLLPCRNQMSDAPQ